jgi:hypothetical protein
MISSCASQNSTSEEVNSLKTQISQLQVDNQQLKEAVLKQDTNIAPSPKPQNSETPKVAITPVFTQTPKASPTYHYIDITLGTTFKAIGYIDFTITRAYFSKQVKPSKASGYYSFYDSKDPNNTFFDTIVSIKNLQTSDLTADNVGSVTIIYNEIYKYKTFATIEENGGSNFTYADITSIAPLTTATIHYLAEVPAELENSNSPIAIIFTVNGIDYKIIFR